METVRSKDGTAIAFDRLGKGPPLVLVGGSFEHRALESETAKLAVFPLLGEHFTLFHYDRRGRGDSTNTPPYAVRREVDDLGAVIDAAGGAAFVSGISSGAALSLLGAAELGQKTTPFVMPDARKRALENQTYEVSPEALGPVLVEFFGSN